MAGIHRNITMSFMLVGHTKFAPDWCFGLFKQKYRRTFVSCLEDVVDAVNMSADANVAQLVGTQSGEPIVSMYDWATFLGHHFRNVPHLKLHHHFTFTSELPGKVEFSDTASSSYQILTDSDWYPDVNILPRVISPNGLSHDRKKYLFTQIHEFCRPGTEDLTCPQPPPRPRPTSPSSSLSGSESDAPRPKRVRHCGLCGQTGHTRGPARSERHTHTTILTLLL